MVTSPRLSVVFAPIVNVAPVPVRVVVVSVLFKLWEIAEPVSKLISFVTVVEVTPDGKLVTLAAAVVDVRVNL